MGTPDFAVGALESIIAAGHKVVLVVTQPDKPKGRGKEMQSTPVKTCAVSHGIPVFQPLKIKTFEAVGILREYAADIFVVAAFGQILSKEILDMPKYGCVNIHASLLPKYRGAAPIQWVIIDGETQTGVTIMQMDEGLDTGDMLMKEVVPITEKETGGSLHDSLSEVGARLIVTALSEIEKGNVTPVSQNEEQTCYAKMLKKSLGHIDWTQSAAYIERLVRGLSPWPSAYTHFHGKTLKIWKADILTDKASGEPGSVSCVAKDSITVNTGEGQLLISELQLEGKKRMQAKEFLLGNHIETGTKFGED